MYLKRSNRGLISALALFSLSSTGEYKISTGPQFLVPVPLLTAPDDNFQALSLQTLNETNKSEYIIHF